MIFKYLPIKAQEYIFTPFVKELTFTTDRNNNQQQVMEIHTMLQVFPELSLRTNMVLDCLKSSLTVGFLFHLLGKDKDVQVCETFIHQLKTMLKIEANYETNCGC